MRQLMRLFGRISRSPCWCVGDDFRLVSVFCVALGSTADTCGASVYKAFWKNFSHFYLIRWIRILRSILDSRSFSFSAQCLVRQWLWEITGCESFSPDDAYVSAWNCFKLMKGKYTINYFQYQDPVECVCMLNVGSAALTIFAPTTTTTSSSS